MYAAAPKLRARAASPGWSRELSIMITGRSISGICRMRSSTAKPSMPGIITSSRISAERIAGLASGLQRFQGGSSAVGFCRAACPNA